jgi:hypothetical protein
MNAKSAALVVSASASKLSVMQVYAEVTHVWFTCPCCNEPLGGFLSDPRGIPEMVCPECGAEFDVPIGAGVVLL